MVIKKPDGKSEVVKRNGDTADIIGVFLEADKDVNWQNQTIELSKQFTPDRKGLKKMMNWVIKNIKYKLWMFDLDLNMS